MNYFDDLYLDDAENYYENSENISAFYNIDDSDQNLNIIHKKIQENEVINNLVKNLGLSLNNDAIIENIVNAIIQILPDAIIATFCIGLHNINSQNIIKLYSPSNIDSKDLDSIKEDIINEAIQLEISNKFNNIENLNKDNLSIDFKFPIMFSDSKTEISGKYIFPISIPLTLNAVIHISFPDSATNSENIITSINTIIDNATQTITNLKRLIDAEYSHFEALVGSLNSAVMMFNTNKEIIVINNPFKKLLGSSCEDMVISDFIETLSSKITSKSKIDTALNKYINLVLEKPYTKKIPEIIIADKYYEVSILSVHDAAKNISGGAFIMHNITSLKELNNQKSNFVSMVSHELKSPLSIIKESAALLSEGIYGKINAQQNELITLAIDNTNRLVRLIDDLLDLSKIEAKKIRLNYSEVNISKKIKSYVKMLKIKSLEQQVKISIINNTKSTFTIDADEDKLEQIILNLLSNSLKYTAPHGNIIIHISEKDTFLEIKVEDTGIGIAKDDMPYLFQKFHRFGNYRKKVKGTGLGLAITKELVELHKGIITAKSELGKGTTISIMIPKLGNQ
jgi:signal transduction histidine kinase